MGVIWLPAPTLPDTAETVIATVTDSAGSIAGRIGEVPAAAPRNSCIAWIAAQGLFA